MTERKSLAVPTLAALAVVPLLLMAAYVGGYFWLGDRTNYYVTESVFITERAYPKRWIARTYLPAAAIEEWWTGNPVQLITTDPYS